ncbi:MAG: PQQ-dependent sugar dehydrogenase, partial [Prosthecobacter sp.]|nr:PQQ-dependent sugar dehydrogenase [Prosthecobacter sp.]
TIPGDSSRLFVVERGGRVQVVTQLGGTPVKSTFLDLATVQGVTGFTAGGECGLLGLAFHPRHLENGEFFIFYSFTAPGLRQRVARMRVLPGQPNLADPASLTPLITQPDQAANHNGGTLAFGPDGYLYISVGDEGGANDGYNNARFINKDFFSAILRVDVDQRPGSLPPNPHPAVHPGTYSIPPDNPFIGATTWHGEAIQPSTVRTEIWATGLRNPFRFSFDAPTGRLFCGDVGQLAREEVHLIRRGDDCGWSWREGSLPFAAGPLPRTPPAGAFFPAEPIYDYGRAGVVQGKSITGGVVYRGRLFPELAGDYLFADYVSGLIVALREQDGVWTPRVLAHNPGITGFGHHPLTGEPIFCDMQRGLVRRLAYKTDGSTAPATLSATGAFTSTSTLAPAPGVVPYEVNVPFWSDRAVKSRWFALRTATSVFGYQKEGRWTLPTGAVWIKHFDIETTPGVPSTRRRLETRFLVKTATDVYGLTYRWREDQQDADLVPMGGLDFPIPGANPPQIWRFPSRSECLSCHNHQAGHALSFHTAQLNRPGPGGSGHQLHALAQAGYLSVRTLEPPGLLPALAPLEDTQHSIDFRARSYLSVNCAPCHQLGSTSLPSSFDARHQVPLELTGLVHGIPTDAGTDPANRLILPGDVTRSVLLHRMAGTGGFGRMPPLGSNLVDAQALDLLSQWVQQGFVSTLSITQQPTDIDARETGPAVFEVAAAGSGTLRYQWRKDRIPIPGETGATLVLASVTPADQAGYDVVVSDDHGSLVSSAARLRIVIQRPTVTNGPPPSDAMVVAPFFWQLSADEPTARFTVQGLPRGLVYDPVRRAIVGSTLMPGPFTVTITPSTVAGVGEARAFTFTLRPLPLGSAGALGAALLEKSAAFNSSMGGRLLLTFTGTGAVSGTLALGPTAWGLRGQLAVSSEGEMTLLAPIPRRGASTLTLSLRVDAPGRRFTGSLTEGAASLPLSGHLFHDTSSVTQAQKDALPARAIHAHLVPGTSSQGNLLLPQGVGILRLLGGKNLTLAAVGRLADGTSVTLGLSALDPHLTSWVSLYAGKGCAVGMLSSAPIHAVLLSAGSPVAGQLSWIKTGPANSMDRSYVPGGFAMDLESIAYLDVPPMAGMNRLGIADAVGNTRLTFTHGGLAPGSMDQDLRLNENGRVTLTPGAGAVPLTLMVNHRTGEFTGSFRLPDGAAFRMASFSGLILPDPENPGRSLGRGYFTLPGQPAATAPILSGAVRLLPQP